jgi:hypothetical protein
MKNPNTISTTILITVALACFAVSPAAPARPRPTPTPTPTATPFIGDLGNGNTSIGYGALLSLTTGTYNTAMGYQALYADTIGSGNIALGANAGINLITGNSNIDIGSAGVAGESGTIRIGDRDIHASVFLAGINPMTPQAPIQAVLVDPSTGQLGSADIGSFPPGPQGSQARKDLPAHRGRQGHKVHRDNKAPRGRRARKECRDHRERRVPKAHRDQLELE